MEREFYCVCVPMAAGVLLAAFLSKLLSGSGDWIPDWVFVGVSGDWMPYATCGICFTATAFLYFEAVCHSKGLGRSVAYWALIFLSLGAVCFFTKQICDIGSVEKPLTLWLKGTGRHASEVLADIPFRDDADNGLARALITGDRSGLPLEVKRSFRDAGAAHMLALSGMHLGIVYLIINKLLLIMGNSPPAGKCRSFLTIVLTAAYSAACGAAPSLLRAWLFITLYEGGKLLGRPQKASDVFCTALTLHLMFRPTDIMNVGFQLSYLAMMGIVFLWPRCRPLYLGDGIGKKIWDLSSLSICCQLFTAPLTLLYFGTFPKYFLITNLVGAPLLSLVMFCCIAAAFLHVCGLTPCWVYQALELPLEALRDLMGTVAGLDSG